MQPQFCFFRASHSVLLPGRLSPPATFGPSSDSGNGPKLCALCSSCTAFASLAWHSWCQASCRPIYRPPSRTLRHNGDIIAATLALLSLLSLPRRAGIVIAWIFNLWGTVDLLNAFYQANHAGLAAVQLGATYFIPTFVVPLLLITHGLAFRILLQHENEFVMREGRKAA